jgi:GAF domain-containing protein
MPRADDSSSGCPRADDHLAAAARYFARMTDGLNLRLLDVLGARADALVAELDADACSISCVIGDVLILVAERVHDGSTLQQGQGYLVPDYPQTAQVLETQEPRTLTLDDADVDAGEADILRSLGFGSLLMAPLEINGAAWGLVEVYRRDRRPFTSANVKRAVELSRIT